MASPDGVGLSRVQVSCHGEAWPWRCSGDGANASCVVAGEVREGCAAPGAQICAADDKDGHVEAGRCHWYVGGHDVSVQGQIICVALLADSCMSKR